MSLNNTFMVAGASEGIYSNGTIDCRNGIQRLIEENKGRTIFFPRGTYYVSKYIHVSGAHNTTITGDVGAKFVFDSATAATDEGATETLYARSCFFVEDSNDITFKGLSFVGDEEETNINENVGRGVYFRNCRNPSVINCRSVGSLFAQDAAPNDRGMLVDGNFCYAFRVPNYTGPEATVVNNRFEQPDTEDFDRVGWNGSSSGLYFFAGRNNIKVIGNTFKNIRLDGVKISGSSAPIYNINVAENTFIDCGSAVECGADDVQLHANCRIANNQIIDCATNRAGWNSGQAIRVLGSESVSVVENQLYYTRETMYAQGGIRGIVANKYTADSSPCRNVRIEGNQFFGIGRPDYIVTQAIYAVKADNAIIRNNSFDSVGAYAIHIDRCVGALVEGNTASNLILAIVIQGCTAPIIANNRVLRGNYTSNTAQIRVDNTPTYNATGNIMHQDDGFIPMEILEQ